jgi:ATP synthase F1 delta subunit
MDITISNLASKYANAFLNLYIDKISIDDFHNIENANKFFSDNKKEVFLFLKLSAISVEAEQKSLNKLFEKLNLIEQFNDLSRLLIAHKRAILLKDVFEKICDFYQHRRKIEIFEIRCPHALDLKELDVVNKFLEGAIRQKGVYFKFQVDQALIAGIRMQSNHYLWEYSVKQKLKKLKGSLIS